MLKLRKKKTSNGKNGLDGILTQTFVVTELTWPSSLTITSKGSVLSSYKRSSSLRSSFHFVEVLNDTRKKCASTLISWCYLPNKLETLEAVQIVKEKIALNPRQDRVNGSLHWVSRKLVFKFFGELTFYRFLFY